jgi:hypothetical protein
MNAEAPAEAAVPEADSLVLPNKFSAEYLRRFYRFKINTLIDVGVLHGTPELYRAFPGAKLVLVDPLPSVEQSVRKTFGATYAFDFHAVGLGSAPGQANLKVRGGSGRSGSSIARKPTTTRPAP